MPRPVAYLDTQGKSALAAVLLALLLWAGLFVAFPGAWQLAEELYGDWVWRLTASDSRERRIILVDIDEPSLRQLGNWPWPRARLAELSDKLAREGAALQVFDIVLPSSEPGDPQLLASLKKNHALLAQVFALEKSTQAASGRPSAALNWAACPPNLPVAHGHIANAPIFSDLPAGHITPLIERDGVIRRQPAVICSEGKAYPALFIAAVVQALGKPDVRLEAGRGMFSPVWRLAGPTLSEEGLPLDASGNVRIPWAVQPQSLVSISAADVLAGRVPAGMLANAWVLVGSTALGLNDRVATPFGGSSAGLAVHAQLLRGVLDARIPVTPRMSWLYDLFTALVGSVVLLAIARQPRRPLVLLAGGAVLCALLLGAAKAVLLARYAVWISWMHVALYLQLLAFSLGLIAHARNRFERDRVYTHLASYLPSPVAAMLVRQDPTGTVDAARRNVTVLLADIRNFSGYCETRPPEESTAVLHAFFSMATSVVEAHGGQIESFQGDAVLALWGNNGLPNNPERALEAALAMLASSRELLPPPQPDDLAPLELGIGLETGIAIVGSFGLARRRTHLAIGHTVTTAARLQDMTGELAHPILIGEGMAACLSDQALESQGMFLLDGLKAPCHIYAYPLRKCLDVNE